MYDFSAESTAGWSTGGGSPPYPFTRGTGATYTREWTALNVGGPTTGPEAGVNGEGYYWFSEVDADSGQYSSSFAYGGAESFAKARARARSAWPPPSNHRPPPGDSCVATAPLRTFRRRMMTRVLGCALE